MLPRIVYYAPIILYLQYSGLVAYEISHVLLAIMLWLVTVVVVVYDFVYKQHNYDLHYATRVDDGITVPPPQFQ